MVDKPDKVATTLNVVPRQAEPTVAKPKKTVAKPVAAPVKAKPAAPPASRVSGRSTAKPRHFFLILGFLLLVAAPISAAAYYLWGHAEDQYASSLAFTVRKENTNAAVGLLDNIPAFSAGGATDADILFQFIQSHEMVTKIDDKMDLRSLFSQNYDTDPLFSFNPDGTIEDLVAFWQRMVQISYDAGSGLIELRVLAFDAETAHALAQNILDESSTMINGLSLISRENATRYARDDLEQAELRLRDAREAITAFRSRTQIVDPGTALIGQMGILNNLQQELASALIELDILRETSSAGDPRTRQAQRKIDVIESRIEEERNKFSVGGEGPGGEDYATLVSEFERLSVDREFAEQSYTAALLAKDAARIEAQRQSLYLAAFVKPTIAERAQYPQRPTLLALVALFVVLTWAILSLIYYSLRDRK